ncbi:MAG: ATP-binding protein [Planctomycetes bacterium]|nr:ATP-binding protein [Planctomycetota bacterium]
MNEPRWDEARLLELEKTEHDFQEFKSSPYIYDPARGGIRADFLDQLSKQLSAFANGGGGHILIGVDDNGTIDGGVPVDLRSGGTREWLEDVVPNLVTPLLTSFNVYEVGSSGPESAIKPGRAVYVIHVPTSEDAPHQARDRRYYLRIAGKSRPMGHRHVLDILHRAQHPDVLIERVNPYGHPRWITSDPRGPFAIVCLRTTLLNRGPVLAQHVGCEFKLPRYAVNSECRRRMLEQPDTRRMQYPGEIVFFVYHPLPLFPTQSLSFADVWLSIHSQNLEHYRAQRVTLDWTVFADAAARREGRVDVTAFNAVQEGIRMVARHRTIRLRSPYRSGGV